MKKFEATTVGKLVFGNRFYFPNDKQRLAWEVIEPNENYPAKKIMVKLVGSVRKKNIDPETEVVFLR